MRKISVIAPLGTSPPVVTEFIQYLENSLKERVSDLTVILTQDPYVKACGDLVEQAILDKYPHIHYHKRELSFTDIDTKDKLQQFMIKMSKLLKDQVEKYHADRIYINGAGGRKDALIALTIIAQFFPVVGVYHIIRPDVQTFNIELERIKHEIEELGKAEDKRSYYLKNKDKFEPIMYPHPSKYSVIKMPIIPYPINELYKIGNLLKENKVKIKDTKLSKDYIESLVKLGIFHSDGSYLYRTDEGSFFLKLIKTVLGNI